ncbi:MAG: hypothetical protein WB767_04915 [Nocardioides sp.]
MRGTSNGVVVPMVEQPVRGTSNGVVETPAARTITPFGSPGLDDAR